MNDLQSILQQISSEENISKLEAEAEILEEHGYITEAEKLRAKIEELKRRK